MTQPQLDPGSARGELEAGECVDRRRVGRQRAHVAAKGLHLREKTPQSARIHRTGTDEFRRREESNL
jgi:hypothetical protein